MLDSLPRSGEDSWMKTLTAAENKLQLSPIASPLAVLHCFGSFLNPTENWIFRMLSNFRQTECWLATPKFLDGEFSLPGARCLRSPLQPRLSPGKFRGGWQRWLRAATTATYPWYLRTKLRHQRIDVVHCHFAHIGWHYRTVARRLSAPLVISFYGWDYVRLAQTDAAWGRRLAILFDEAACFLCEGPHGASLLRSQGCPNDKIHVAPLGVDVTSIPFTERSKHTGELKMVQVASFRDKKGHIDTINAFADALDSCPNMSLTFIGATDGPIQDSIKQVVNARGIQKIVTLMPSIAPAALHAQLLDYQIFIHPSRHAEDGDCEGGAPVVLLDAQATGMPVISTTHCDIPQEVIDGQTGLLSQERDVAGLSRAIQTFYAMDQSQYTTFAQAARKHVEMRFDVRNCAAQVEAIYRELTTTPKTGHH